MKSHAKASFAESKGRRVSSVVRLAPPVAAFVVIVALTVVASALAASPVVTTGAATGSTGTKATLNGTVNPEGEELNACKFEYGVGNAFGQTVACAESLGSIGSGTSPVSVHADISNLQPNGTFYSFRLVATNPSGTVNGSTQNFTTPNTVITTAATGVTSNSATLNGTVNPDGVAMTECVFEWGLEKPFYESIQTYANTTPCVPSAAGIGSGTSPVAVSASITGLAVGVAYHYRLKAANANGPIVGADQSFQTTGPRLKGTWSESVTYTEATLKAKVNPAGLATTYTFQWGTTNAYGDETPVKSVGSDSSDHVIAAFLEGLQPNTLYHYRVIVTDGAATSEGPDRTFATYAHPAPETDCPNQMFRVGSSASLPDCRAYEMVSPVDKNGSDIAPGFQNRRIMQAAIGGDAITYSSYTAFGDQPTARISNQYLARRGIEGWSTHGISPPLGPDSDGVISAVDINQRFQAFSPDLSATWMSDVNLEPLTPDGLEGHINVYARDNVADGYDFVLAYDPSTISGSPYVQGYSADLTHVVFRNSFSGGSLHALVGEGEPISDGLWDYSGGKLHPVSVFPSGTFAELASLGTATSGLEERITESLDHAVSQDGSRVFWSASTNGPGLLFVRVNPAEDQSAVNGSGECTEPAKACTIPISTSIESGAPGRFWSADSLGTRALVSIDPPGAPLDDLYEFDVDAQAETLIAPEVVGVLGASDDLSHVYFVSREDLAPGAVSGSDNLYLAREGTTTFITTLAPVDTQGQEPAADGGIYNAFGSYNVASLSSFPRPSRVTPDGHHIVFQSVGNLTGYDNIDARNGERDIEVYVYDADADRLSCASCNPSGARPVGAPLQRAFSGLGDHPVSDAGGLHKRWAAAWIPTWEYSVYASRSLSEDGSRVFFNSFDALLPQDTNGVQDVYQWEAAGSGTCEEGAPSYSALNDGCVSLISSGESPRDSEFVDADATGRDVFFETGSSLLVQDEGLVDIYDARVGGGFPPPQAAAPECVGDACQSVPEPPNDPTPASTTFRGAGDPTPRRTRFRCRPRRRPVAKRHQRAAHKGATKRSRLKKAKRCTRANRGGSR